MLRSRSELVRISQNIASTVVQRNALEMLSKVTTKVSAALFGLG